MQNLPSKLKHALFLRCPLCGKTKLLKNKSWFVFEKGCEHCQYNFEREDGYFSGASWMVGYGILGLLGLVTVAILHKLLPELESIKKAAIISSVFAVGAFAFFPWFKSIWMWLDLKLHPLEEKDHVNFLNSNRPRDRQE